MKYQECHVWGHNQCIANAAMASPFPGATPKRNARPFPPLGPVPRSEGRALRFGVAPGQNIFQIQTAYSLLILPMNQTGEKRQND